MNKEHQPVNRKVRALSSFAVAAALLLAPTAAGASDENLVYATNETAGAAVSAASVQYRVAPNGVVDERNVAYAVARCTDCQTVATAFQLVLVTRAYRTFVPYNEAFAGNLECDTCLSWATAKQVIVVTDGPAALTGAGHIRMQALEDRLLALQADLPALTLGGLLGELDSAFAELLDIATTEIMAPDGGPVATELVATGSS
jgi:putative peptide zinc metalloprotease protein